MFRIYKAFIYALQGLKHALKFEFAFQIETILACVLIPVAFLIGETIVEIILLISSTLLILIVELINSAIEITLNRIGEEQNNLTKIAKDMASAGVLVSLILWVFVWGLILLF